MSCPWGRSWVGILRSFRSGQPATARAEMELSIQVSKTSFSGIKSSLPHLHLTGGLVWLGSRGSHSSLATSTSPQERQYQTGMGVAKILCRRCTSPFHRVGPVLEPDLHMGRHPFDLLRSLLISSALIRTNHCLSDRISMGVLHLQHRPTFCSKGSCLKIMSSFCISWMILSLAWLTEQPA